MSDPSRKRFDEFKASLAKDKSTGGSYHGSSGGENKNKKRDRSAFELIFAFLKLLRPHRVSVLFALSTLVVSTVLSLIPPAGTKFVVD